MTKEKLLTWNLTHIIKDEKEFFQIVKEVEQALPKYDLIIKRLSNKIKEKEFIRMMDFDRKIEENMAKIGAYASLIAAANTKSQEVMKYQTILEKLSIQLADKSRPIGHWLQGLSIKERKGLDDKNAKRLFKIMKEEEYNLWYGRKMAKHTLSESAEKLLLRKGINGVPVIKDLYEQLTTSFTYEFKPKGQKPRKIESQEELLQYAKSEKREERKAAYEALFKEYKERKEIMFNMYAAIIKDWRTEQELRKYPSAINKRNVANRIRDEVVEKVLEVATKNRIIYQEFFKIKAKELGVKKLSRFDVYAPIKQADKKISFEEAKQEVLQVFKNFHGGFAEKAEKIWKEQHVDSHPRKNKRSGAFCMDVLPGITPYILLNFTGKRRDVSTMAHELGHGIHDLYNAHLPITVSHPPLTLAETASTFGEMLLFEEQLKKESKKERKEMLMEKLANSYGTIARQAYFIKFELEAHKRIPEGLTEEELSNLYLDHLKELFGDAVDIPEEFKYEWSYIPHIFATPFYCYAYTFGDLLTLALYSAYKREGKIFIQKLERILSAGGSQDPEILLKREGFDISKEEFWEEGFKVIQGWLDEVKEFREREY